MTPQIKQRLFVFEALGLVLAVPLLYLLTLGHCFLPLRLFDYRGERIEAREYDGLAWRMYGEYTPWIRARENVRTVADRILYPGRSRLDAAIAKIERAHGSYFTNSGPDSEIQQTLEAIGYAFPVGCSASVETNNVYRFLHYPSMLNRIEKDLWLKRHSSSLSVGGGPISPNHTALGNGAPTLLFHAARQFRAMREQIR
jgi:hypothetical protein